MEDIQIINGEYYENGQKIVLHEDEEKKIDSFLKHMRRISEEKVCSSPKRHKLQMIKML